MPRPICVQKRQLTTPTPHWVACVIDADEVLMVVGNDPDGHEPGSTITLKGGQFIEVKESIVDVYELLSPVK